MLPPCRDQRVRPPAPSRVLAPRSPSVVPVGVWVESALGQPQQSLAYVSALRVEEELKKQEKEKAARLRCFQVEVKRRVNQQVRLRRKQQLQRSYEAAERESCVAAQYAGSGLGRSPRKDTCLFRSHPTPTICCPSPAQHHGMQSEPFQQRATQLSKAMKQVRRRLVSCRTISAGAGPTQLPGGLWRREKAEPPLEEESEELLLVGHHDLPAELQDQDVALPRAEQEEDFYIKIEFKKSWDGSVKDSHSPESPQRPHTYGQTPLMLWAGADQEETKKQRQSEFLRHRRLFMSIEREQVKEQQRQRESQKRVTEIKGKKENQRRVEEQRLQEAADQTKLPQEEGIWEALAQHQLEERRVRKVKEKQQQNKENVRYIEALRAHLREKIKLSNIDLPPLCSCGSNFWDSHPDTCANNCVFYRNHRAYSHALQSLVLSCIPAARSPTARLRLRDLAALYARWGQHL
ncbi:coiled-coil domain-containing protein 15 isoform X1 [Calypte anna]|uniref:coiled-coil domain-containing protein 15 isoform X1 n=1 Tax=Calypte anna TaxID=9244 RepID=UPI0011C48223|nr:coiled-coil domain-containing protein 15 isoform X1 [Calypte anna]XP_030320630.1 coiled-coil domain-containing protein 15 isoform X1 [Calypte anna]XP_030320631.1 coiled-coil domain-containing protein 15 isoform X1 [Calypte anna]